MALTDQESADYQQAAEFFRLTLAKLGEYKLAVNAVNYALVYFYVSGEDQSLNSTLEPLFERPDQWTDETARKIFQQYLCGCNAWIDDSLREDLLMTVAQILGSVVDIAGKTAISTDTLEGYMEKLAMTSDSRQVLKIASDIIAETRNIISRNSDFESTLQDSTQEIAQLKDQLDRARAQATHDALTGLYNRRGFDQEIESIINQSAELQDRHFCLLLIDVDHFKTINDNHGHLVGDKVLKGLSKLFHNQMRGNDFLSRFGGEEFAIILRNTMVSQAFTVAENLRTEVEKMRLKHMKTGEEIGQVTISIGVACHRDNESSGALIERSDQALYRAKSLGRNRSVIAD